MSGSGNGGIGGGGGQDPSYYANIEHDKLEREANTRRDQEVERTDRIKKGTDRVNAEFANVFTPDFYKQRTNSYTNFYKPQLDDQYAGAQKQLTYWLSDRGLLNSSVRNDKLADAQKTYNDGLRQINTGALDATNQTRNQVETAKAGLIKDVRDTNDPEGAGQAASGTVQSLSAPETYSPLGDLFSTFTRALGQQARAEQASYLSNGAYKPAFNTGLFAPNPGSVRTTY